MKRITKAPEERRHELLDAAEKLFSEYGYSEVPVEEIIRSVGIAKGTFYYYFRSKSDIMDAILDRRLSIIEGITHRLVSTPGEDAISRLQSILKLLFHSGMKGEPGQKQLELDKNPEFHKKFESGFHSRIAPYIKKVVEEGKNEGAFAILHPEDITEILLFGIQGYMHIKYPSFTDLTTFNKSMRAIEELMCKALGMKDGSIELTMKEQA